MLPKDKSKIKTYYQKNRKHIRKKATEYYQKNKEIIKLKSKKYYEENKEKIKKYRESIKDKKSKYMKKYRKIHKEEIRISKKLYRQNRLKNDFNYALENKIRKRISKAIKNEYKNTSTKNLLGGDIKIIKNHLETQFTKGMSWENHGRFGWHIDHIKPCCSFDLSDPEEQKKCFHYTNLQPLWWQDNLRKAKK